MYKRIYLMVIILVMILLPVAAYADTANTLGLLTQALMPLIVIIVSPLIARLFRKLGIDIADSTLEPILMRIIEIIARVEGSDMTGEQKKDFVSQELQRTLSKAEIKALIKRYGSLQTAVQAAFEQSSVAYK
ncbi:MAG: hypothetical protein PHC50_06220 [Candidatus Cloacimonetes bacterium]|nr:hypothetical protein [Candidatus Cloacimonadota bacterium]